MQNKKKVMANEATKTKLTAAQEAMTNDREPSTNSETCPFKEKNCSLEAWKSEMEIGYNSNNARDTVRPKTKRYIELMESVREAGDKNIGRTASTEPREHQESEKKAKNVTKTMVDKLKAELGDSDVERSNSHSRS